MSYVTVKLRSNKTLRPGKMLSKQFWKRSAVKRDGNTSETTTGVTHAALTRRNLQCNGEAGLVNGEVKIQIMHDLRINAVCSKDLQHVHLTGEQGSGLE